MTAICATECSNTDKAVHATDCTDYFQSQPVSLGTVLNARILRGNLTDNSCNGDIISISDTFKNIDKNLNDFRWAFYDFPDISFSNKLTPVTGHYFICGKDSVNSLGDNSIAVGLSLQVIGIDPASIASIIGNPNPSKVEGSNKNLQEL